MVHSIFAYVVYSSLNSIFNILKVIMTQYRFLAKKNAEIWKLSLVIYLGFWPFEPQSLMNFFLIKIARV